ncbi:MAG: hypothetical protein ACE37D_12575 [Pseudomonadales bacterium]
MFEIQASKVTSVKNDLLSGITVHLALVPEAVTSLLLLASILSGCTGIYGGLRGLLGNRPG